MSAARALMIAAPSSGAGKTTVTLGVLRALRDRALPGGISGAKSGPDYIDPRFHAAASGAECPNLDAWAMAPARTGALLAQGAEAVIVEGAMGLFDGAPDGRGSCAELALRHDIPVVLVLDVARMAQSVRALARGFARDPDGPDVVGLILNRVGSPRHEAMLRAALDVPDLPPVLGVIPRSAHITQPSRHLGLVQAGETPELERILTDAADLVRAHVDLDRLLGLLRPVRGLQPAQSMRPPAQRIAIARDEAFDFAYPHMLQDWHRAGAELSFFSPLADEGPGPCDFVFLPGGYPELHAGRLAQADTFRSGMKLASQSAHIYGECGGYMVLGDGLIDGDGTSHPMLGLLRLETSYATRKLHLGYRRVQADRGVFAGSWRAHEFHYSVTTMARGTPLFTGTDATGAAIPPAGLHDGRVSGSYLHLIDRDAAF